MDVKDTFQRANNYLREHTPNSFTNEDNSQFTKKTKGVAGSSALLALALIGWGTHVVHGEHDEIRSSFTAEAGRQLQDVDMVPKQDFSARPDSEIREATVLLKNGKECTVSYETQYQGYRKFMSRILRNRAVIVETEDDTCKRIPAPEPPKKAKKAPATKTVKK